MSGYIYLDKTERPTVDRNQYIDFDVESKEYDSIFEVTLPHAGSTLSGGLIVTQNNNYGGNRIGSYDGIESVDDSSNTEPCNNNFDDSKTFTDCDNLSYEKDQGNNYGAEEISRESGSLWNKIIGCGAVVLGVTGVIAYIGKRFLGDYEGLDGEGIPDQVRGLDVLRRSSTRALGPVGPTPTPDIAVATQIRAPTGQTQIAQEMAIQAANNMLKSATEMSHVAAGAPASSGASSTASSSANASATLAVAAVAVAAYATMPGDVMRVCNVNPEIYPGKVFLRLGNLNQTLSITQRQAVVTNFDEIYNEVIGSCDDSYERFGVDMDFIEESFGSLDNGIPYVNIILEGKVRCHGCVPSEPFFGEHGENLHNTTSDSASQKVVEVFSILESMLDDVFADVEVDVQLLQAGEVDNNSSSSMSELLNGESVGFKFSELTLTPSNTPTIHPSRVPSQAPTTMPSTVPSTMPSSSPSTISSNIPSRYPSEEPTFVHSSPPSDKSSLQPSIESIEPSRDPSQSPTLLSSGFPTLKTSSSPSTHPTLSSSSNPSSLPSISASSAPSIPPSAYPSKNPSSFPSTYPTLSPSLNPSYVPSISASNNPSALPSLQLSYSPSAHPTSQPSAPPSEPPSILPSNNPSISPSESPSVSLSFRPSIPPSYGTFAKRPYYNIHGHFGSNPKVEEGVLANPNRLISDQRGNKS